ncbi:MAG: hypothetical protein RLZZ106_1282, partial [Cyanobacteriota bacterium]
SKNYDFADVDAHHGGDEQPPWHPDHRREGLSPQLVPRCVLVIVLDAAFAEVEHSHPGTAGIWPDVISSSM